MGLSELEPVSVVLAGLGVLLAIIGGGLTVALTIKQLMQRAPQADPDKEFVTRAELSRTVDELEKKIDGVKTDITTLKDDVGRKLDKQSEYASRIAHEQANVTHQMSLKLERLLTLREADVAAKTKTEPDRT